MKKINLSLILVFSTFLISGQTPNFKDYDSAEGHITKLIENQDYKSAIQLLEKIDNQFPENYFQIKSNLAYCLVKTKEYQKSMAIWKAGHQKGYFFGLGLGFPTYKALEDISGFDKLKKRDMELREKAMQKSKTIYQVKLPKNFDSKTRYPLLIVLHGGGSSNRRAMKSWECNYLNKKLIRIYIQSYLHYDYGSFGWKGYDPRARQAIKEIYSEIVKKFPIDTSKILVGGISAGAVTAIDLAINNIIPVTGFIGVCALTPRKFDKDRVKKAVQRGLRGVFIGGDKDFGYKRQKEMEKVFIEEKMVFLFMFNEGLGHELPKDFPSQLQKAITFLTT